MLRNRATETEFFSDLSEYLFLNPDLSGERHRKNSVSLHALHLLFIYTFSLSMGIQRLGLYI